MTDDPARPHYVRWWNAMSPEQRRAWQVPGRVIPRERIDTIAADDGRVLWAGPVPNEHHALFVLPNDLADADPDKDLP